ncbi:MAG: NAD(P)H-hydrate dehydratase, partial [Betaproteobacteria bacterium]
LDAGVIHAALPPRAAHSHKGTYGDVAILGGATGMTGAALLAGRAALLLGAGRTFVGFLDPGAPTVDMLQPELMLRTAVELIAIASPSVLVAGPGLGRSEPARNVLAQAIARVLPLVLDADALNLIASESGLAAAVARRNVPTVMTPHPAEAGRLLGVATVEIQRDRVASARRIAERFNAFVVLKGAGSICAAPSGEWFVNTSGNAGMASAGMGDVLTGIVAAFIAQGASPMLALAAGVHLHGLAGDRLRTAHGGPVGMTASEIVAAARAVLNETIYPAG